jgi:hypothetical protein
VKQRVDQVGYTHPSKGTFQEIIFPQQGVCGFLHPLMGAPGLGRLCTQSGRTPIEHPTPRRQPPQRPEYFVIAAEVLHDYTGNDMLKPARNQVHAQIHPKGGGVFT